MWMCVGAGKELSHRPQPSHASIDAFRFPYPPTNLSISLFCLLEIYGGVFG